MSDPLSVPVDIVAITGGTFSGDFLILYPGSTSETSLYDEFTNPFGTSIFTTYTNVGGQFGFLLENAAGNGVGLASVSGTNQDGLYGQFFNTSYNAQNNPVQIYSGDNAVLNGGFTDPLGNFDVFYSVSTASGTTAYEQTLNSQGALGGSAQSLSPLFSTGVVAENASGASVLVYNQTLDSGAVALEVQPLNADFSFAGSPTQIAVADPGATVAPAPKFVLPNPDGSFDVFYTGANGLYEQQVTSAGSPVGTANLVNVPAGATISENNNGNFSYAYATASGVDSNGVYTNPQLTTGSFSPACYCPGTLILTDAGEVPVENLQIGDRILTFYSGMQPIKWIGRRSYSARFARSRRDDLSPVCIKAGALAADLPRRDLWVSPHHAIFFPIGGDGVLVEAIDLLNGVSIYQAIAAENIDYIHIELEHHDVLTAEGTLSETYLDDDNRGIFHNADEYFALYGHEPLKTIRYCSPRINEGFILENIRRSIIERTALRAVAI